MTEQGNMALGRGINVWRIAGWGLAAALLLTPLVAMQFTAELRWGPLDFALAALLIGGVGLGLEPAVRKTRNGRYRAGAALAVLTAFLLIWITLAVGFLGEEGNPVNLMFAGVLLVALVGAVAARFRPKGMALAMAAAAGAQLLIAIMVFVADLASPPELGLTLAFVLPWLASAALFLLAGRAAACRVRGPPVSDDAGDSALARA